MSKPLAPEKPLGLPSTLAAGLTVLAIAALAGTLFFYLGCEVRTDGALYIGGLKPCLKDTVQATLSVVGLFTIAATAWGVVNELRKQHLARSDQATAQVRNNELRAEDLRWRQAQEARALCERIHKHDLASIAIQMMDWAGMARDYAFDDDYTVELDWATIQDYVATPNVSRAPACHVVDAFDWLLYYLNEIEHAIVSNLILEQDVLPTLAPYLEKLQIDSAEPQPESLSIDVSTLVAARRYDNLRSLQVRARRQRARFARHESSLA